MAQITRSMINAPKGATTNDLMMALSSIMSPVGMIRANKPGQVVELMKKLKDKSKLLDDAIDFFIKKPPLPMAVGKTGPMNPKNVDDALEMMLRR